MDKKVTRRVVLGSAVTCLAVGPFITRSFLRRMPEGDSIVRWRTNWNERIGRIVPNIGTVSTDGRFECVPKLDGVAQKNYSILMPICEKAQWDSDDIPERYTIKEGSYEIDRRISRTLLIGQDKVDIALSKWDSYTKTVGGTWCLDVSTDNGVSPVIYRNGEITKVDATNSPDVYMGTLAFYIPFVIDAPNKELRSGDFWDVDLPFLGGMLFGRVRRKVEGVCKVDDDWAIKVSTVQSISYTDTVKIFRDVISMIGNAEYKQSLQRQVKEIEVGQFWSQASDVTYYSLSNGLLLYRFCERRVGSEIDSSFADVEVLYTRVV